MTITDAELAAFKLCRCGDASCIFGAQGTSDTDAGCRCLTQRSDADAIKFMRAAFLARNIAADRDKLCAEVAALTADRDHWKLRAEIEREHVAVLTRRP